MAVYRVRWSFAIGTSLTAPVLIGLIIVLVLRPLAFGGSVAIILGLTNVLFTVRRMRRRSMRVDDSGMQIQRDRYALKVPWEAVTGVRRRRLQYVLSVDELVLTHSEVIGLTSKGRAATPPRSLQETPEATERIQVSVYDKNWRSGPIGDQLRARGIIGGLREHGLNNPSAAHPSAADVDNADANRDADQRG